MLSFATKITHVSTVGSAVVIESNESIRVYGIICNAASGAPSVFTFKKANAGATLLIVDVLAGSSFETGIPFLSDSGLELTISGAGATATVFHSQGAA